ncbi:nickel transporter permease [Desulforamulus hydrothermalis]|uniref:Putative peptide transporter permease subunit: membrane component of ABC superfamily n=1 Tax=Desulforamulus hydrothermalis Lam5 = DSM 18033 TaxID=1121428 RepID=K8E0L6_9FIRM|nr:nickel transporter permease [Desulforamulus hydrothermalis]CCO09127.1 putative peptide transporter permease subunit: membrane component of ABC superfamily [Desulforamulus hydrothermalis Lam5 = DSM 18033]SHH12062.1 oligopeptide transport system permease protein [Desulforamulus hydrothermalis Lam5 = DSM 18033]
MSQAQASVQVKQPAEQAYSPAADFWRRLRKNKLAMVSLVFLLALSLMAVLAPFVAPYDPYLSDMPKALQGPSAQHWLGNDELGRDILSRIIYGARISLRVGLIAVGIALSVGMTLGSLAGYYGGRLDNLIMRVMDIMLAFPSILLAIALMAVLGRGVENAIIAIGIVSIPEYARIVRGSVLSVKENEYVQAARAIGNNDLQIIFRHILPNVMAPVIVRATLGISTAILETSALGFLGLGVVPPYAEWGTMLGSGRGYMFNAPHLVFFPGIAITLTVMAFNLLGDGLRDALDPRLRR